MTREEMLKWLERIEKDIYVCSLESTFADDAKSCAIHKAIKALSAEPCRDYISRQAVLNEMERRHQEGDTITKGFIKSLPPVNPTRPKGEWLFTEIINDYYVTGQCSRCTQRNRIDNFCPNCGADMRGEENEQHR